MSIRWWRTRPSQAVRGERLRQGLCPRCGSPRTVPVIYGLIHDVAAIKADHPDGFAFGGDRVKTFEDPGPDRSCQRCGYRFYGDNARHGIE